jgi:hypothetical protein
VQLLLPGSAPLAKFACLSEHLCDWGEQKRAIAWSKKRAIAWGKKRDIIEAGRSAPWLPLKQHPDDMEMAQERKPLHRLVGHKIQVSTYIHPHWRIAPVMSPRAGRPGTRASAQGNIVDIRTYARR